ncbi:glycosyltransferase family 4 protein [Cloacibacillus evryensis]|uniref:glycosyltransferase family 4 protein n=1 Tax=Cloacibacillus evryensis TaxID=508460 RepID=UPI0022E0D901|nr:glycosyltransferase family 4 protein [Cloacibacillus evryensis]
MKKDILFLCQFFYPEYISSARLPFDLAKALAQAGYAVGAICGYPKEYASETKVEPHEEVDGIKIKRLRYLQMKRSSFVGRIINYLSFTLSVLLHLFSLSKYKIIIVYSNPPMLPLIALLSKSLFGNKVIFVGFDIYPEIAYTSNVITNTGTIYKLLSWVSNVTIKYSDKVIALSEDMKDFLLKERKYPNKERISIIPIWATEEMNECNQQNKNEKFIVSYLGNMGICQDMKTILDAAELLQKNDVEDVEFVLAGHGNKLPEIKKTCQEKSLKNVKIYDFLQGNDFIRLLQKSGCFVLSLEKGLVGLCLPSKVCTYLQAGRPVIAVMEKEFEVSKNLKEYNAGFSVLQGQGEALAEYIRLLKDNDAERNIMGNNARRLYEDKYAKPINIKKFACLIKQIHGGICNV